MIQTQVEVEHFGAKVYEPDFSGEHVSMGKQSSMNLPDLETIVWSALREAIKKYLVVNLDCRYREQPCQANPPMPGVRVVSSYRAGWQRCHRLCNHDRPEGPLTFANPRWCLDQGRRCSCPNSPAAGTGVAQRKRFLLFACGDRKFGVIQVK